MMKKWIWLDDTRIPIYYLNLWIITTNYDEFVREVEKIGLQNIDLISLDHDLGDSAMEEFFKNTAINHQINYNNIKEKTGYDAAKWLINYSLDKNIPLPEKVLTHSANPVGAANIMGIINNYLRSQGLPQTCVRTKWDYIIRDENKSK